MRKNEVAAHIMELTASVRNYRQYLETLVAPYKYVIFYGCGEVFHNLVSNWNRGISKKIDFVCDRNPDKWNKRFLGIPCISPDELLKIKDDCAFFISMGNIAEAKVFADINGLKPAKWFCKYDLVFFTQKNVPSLPVIREKLEQCSKILADKQSEKVFDAVVQRVLGNGDLDGMGSVLEGDQYFPMDIIHLTKQECLVDAGAFTGDTMKDFLKRCEHEFAAYHAFELSEQNYIRLSEFIKTLPQEKQKRIFAYKQGVGNLPCKVSYNENSSGSIVGGGEISGEITTLDLALAGKPVTFIKMDIEGFELKALHGAEKIIREQKPKIAACVYHEFNHLWEIPLYLKTLVPEYKIYLRHHTQVDYETVCYAVCDEQK